MGKKKRIYPPKAYYEEIIDRYFAENEDEIINYTIDKLGFGDFDELREAECHMYFGLDCGFTKIYPKNKEMEQEWILDEHGREGEYFWAEIYPRFAWNCQSLTCKRPQAEKMLRDLGLENEFGIRERLD